MSDKDVTIALKLGSRHADYSKVTVEVGGVHGVFAGVKHFGRHHAAEGSDDSGHVLGKLRSAGQLHNVLVDINHHAGPLVDGIRALDGEGTTRIKDLSVFGKIPQGNIGNLALDPRRFDFLREFPKTEFLFGTSS